jgi:hypothetical protein
MGVEQKSTTPQRHSRVRVVPAFLRRACPQVGRSRAQISDRLGVKMPNAPGVLPRRRSTRGVQSESTGDRPSGVSLRTTFSHRPSAVRSAGDAASEPLTVAGRVLPDRCFDPPMAGFKPAARCFPIRYPLPSVVRGASPDWEHCRAWNIAGQELFINSQGYPRHFSFVHCSRRLFHRESTAFPPWCHHE